MVDPIKVLDGSNFNSGIQANFKRAQGITTSSNNISRPAESPSNAYRIAIVCSDLNKTIVGFLPENISLSINSSYGTPFEQLNVANMIGGAIGGELGQAVASIGGITGMVQAMTVQVWQGSSGIDMSIPLVLTDNVDPQNIVKTIMDLYQLSAPSAPDGIFSLMRPPGPTLKSIEKLADIGKQVVSAAGSELMSQVNGTDFDFSGTVKAALAEGMMNQITVAIGNYMVLPSVVIKAIDTNFFNYLSSDALGNKPWRADVTVNISTLWNPSIEDLYDIFKLPRPTLVKA